MPSTIEIDNTASNAAIYLEDCSDIILTSEKIMRHYAKNSLNFKVE